MTDSEEYTGNIGLITKTGDESIPLIGVFAEATIIGKSSKVKITQKYKNNGKNAVEAVYKFPLPEGASVTGFRILLKDKDIKGEIEEREKAFMVYDDAMIKGDGAVLLDQERPNIFTLSVGNLNPGNEAGIEIEYISVPDFKNNNLKFFLPTTISPRYIPAGIPDEGGIPVEGRVNPEYAGAVSYGLSLKVNVLKSDGMDISSISSPSHKVKTGFNESFYTVEFTSQSVIMDRDFVLEIGYGKAALNRAVYFNAGQEGFMQIDFNPDLAIHMQENNISDGSRNEIAKNSDIIFVLDCSGSMEGSSIAQAKKSLEILIKALSPGQLFNIYRFGSSFDKFSLRGEHFDEISLKAAMEFLDKTDASFGGTEILAPLKDIFASAVKSVAGNSAGKTENSAAKSAGNNGPNSATGNVAGSALMGIVRSSTGKIPNSSANNGEINSANNAAGSAISKPADNSDYIKNIKNIVLITDGEVGNEAEVVRLVHSNKGFFRVFTVGIGFGPNEYFIKEMAQSTGADYIMVHPEERIELKVISMFKKLDMGAVENIKIDFGIKNGDVDAVPEFHSIFSENSYQIFAKINNAAEKSAAGKSAEGTSIRGGSLEGSNSEGMDLENSRVPIYSQAGTLENTQKRPFYEISNIVPESVLITGIFKGKDLSWSLPVAVADRQDGFAGFIPQLWAREKIREIEGGFAGIKGSQQTERKVGQIDDLIISISKKYGVISSKTSFVSVEERSEEEKTKGEVTLKKIPTLVTYGWHGFGAQGAVPDQAFMLNCAMPAMPAMSKMRPGAHKGFVSKNVSRSRLNNTASYKLTESMAEKVPCIRSADMSADFETEHKEEILLEILASQKPSGGFELGIRLAGLLKIDIAELKTIASGIKINGINYQDLGTQVNLMPNEERFNVLATALLMGILDKFFSDSSDSWGMVVEKSRKWLDEKITNFKPEIKSDILKDFISGYILKINIFKK